MGLGDADLLDDGDRGGCKAAPVSCSICLDAVTDNGDRSWAKLQCGHQFHLDCIGSAFNSKGAMQCPNCRKIEKGQWLYANGSRPLPEFSMDDWAHDEDLYDLNYSEMSFGVHWCPFSGITRLPSSFDEGEFSSSTYHDLVGHTPVFEHTPVSSATHPCPYIAYFGPIHASSTTSSTSVSDGSNYSNHWTGPSVPSEVPNSYTFPSMDVHYHNWDHSSQFAPSNRIAGADQTLIAPMSQRTARNSSDIPRAGMHPPFMLGHSSASRAPSSATSSVLPPYPGTVARTRDRPSFQAYFQQSSSNPSARNPVLPTGRRSSSHRGLAQAAPPIASSSDQSGGFYFFSSNSSGRNFHEMENPHREPFHGWEREHQPSFPSSQVDRDSIWGPFHPPGPASETGIRHSSFRLRHGSERMPSQNR
ncbi:E3 ubiquitin-protein ligase IPI1 isoform X1 [Salvia hispanica]|uniref:E3 ubiquitin-protein ligase IPI1 isoform X1 n=1 Tax=Salvia hispanica TaxID=49212 RepID=UPI00200946E9|nr:E3 ubiquitin-protein ligase IPI1 isoform X1 [Salvia hispanica]